MNILICSAGKRVSLVRAFQKELKSIVPTGKVFTTDLNPQLSPACQIADGYFEVCRVTSVNYISHILKICIDNNIKMVIPTIDTELQTLADQRTLFNNHHIHLILSDSEFIFKCRDKRLINSFFLNHHICIPKQIDKKNLTFPLFIKPYDGSLSKDTFLISKKSEITDFHLSNDKFMFMEYLDPINNQEYTVDMYYGRDNFVKCIIPRKRIEVRAGEVSKGVTIKNEILLFLKERLNYLDGVAGCVTLQLFFNIYTKAIVGIEINPRFGGGFPLSYLAGGNFPRWIIEEYLFEKEHSYNDNWEENLLMLRYDDEIIVHGFKN